MAFPKPPSQSGRSRGFSRFCWAAKLIWVTAKLEPESAWCRGRGGGRFWVNSGRKWPVGSEVWLGVAVILTETSGLAVFSTQLGRARNSPGKSPWSPQEAGVT